MATEVAAAEHRRIKNVKGILKENRELYDTLYDNITAQAGGNRLGRTENVLEMMVHYFPPEMAELMVYLGKEPKKAEQVAEESGKPLGLVKEILHRYWRSGVSRTLRSFIEEKGYVLPPSWDSLEVPTCYGVNGTFKYWDEDEEIEVGFLQSKIHFEDHWLYQRAAPRATGPMVLVDERFVDDPSTMEDWEKPSQHVLQVAQVGVTRCGCRVRHGIYNNCRHKMQKPKIDVCLQFDSLMAPYVDTGGGEWTTKEEGLDTLWTGLDAGLVAVGTQTAALPGVARFICFCCPDCCHIIYPWATLGVTGASVHRTNFDPKIDLKKCDPTACGGGNAPCIKACPIQHIRFYHPPTKRDRSDEFVGVDLRRCWGCGICAGACPQSAIKMVKARNWVPVPMTPEQREKAGRHEWIDKPSAL